MKVKSVLILLEHISRERGLAEHLVNKCKSEFYVEIRSIPYDLYTINFIKYDVILIPFVPSSPSPFASLVKELLSANKIVISLNWEQYLSPIAASYRRNAFQQFNSTELLVCSWSNQFSDYLLESGFSNGNILKVQNYNSMLLKRKVLLSKESTKLENIIFFPMNYAWAFADKNFIKYRVKTGYSEVIADEFVEYSKKCLTSFIKNLGEFSKLNPDFKIVVKEHPGVSQEWYESFLKTQDVKIPENVKFIYEGEVSEFLLKSRVVISSWSTTVLDRFLIDGSSLLFTPFERPDWLSVHWNSDLLNLDNLNYTVSEIEQKLKGHNSARFSNYEEDLDFDVFFENIVINNKYSFFCFLKIKVLQFRFFTYNKKNRIIFWLNRFGFKKTTGFESDRFIWDKVNLKIKTFDL